MVPFVAPDVDVVPKLLIQNFQTPRPYPQSINQHPVFLHRFPSKVSEVFHPCRRFQPYRSVFLLVSSSSLGDFSLIKSPVFPPRFLIKFRKFFHQLNIHGFLLSLSLSLGGFLNQAMTSNAYTRLSELASKREGNCNVMKSFDLTCDRSNLIRTISYHNSS